MRYCSQTCIGKSWCPDGNRCKAIQPVPYACKNRKYSIYLGGIPSRLPIQESGHVTEEAQELLPYSIMNLLEETRDYKALGLRNYKATEPDDRVAVCKTV